MATTKNTWSKTNHSQLPAHTKRTFIILNPSKMNSYIEPIKIHHLSLQSSSQCVPVKLLSVYKQSLTLISLENLPQVRNLPRQFQENLFEFFFWSDHREIWMEMKSAAMGLNILRNFFHFNCVFAIPIRLLGKFFFCFLSSSDSSSMKSRPHCGAAYNKREQKVRIFWGTVW